jgi:hypothetical protein
MGEKRNTCGILVGKREETSPPGRPRHRWVDNIKIDVTETEWDGMDWIDLAQDRDQWRAHGNGPSSSIKCWEVFEMLHNWRLLKKVSDP